jgi:hypothetical protein
MLAHHLILVVHIGCGEVYQNVDDEHNINCGEQLEVWRGPPSKSIMTIGSEP